MSAGGPDFRIQVFARSPEPGRTKTRLIPVLGPEGAAALHERLIRHSLEAAAASGAGAVELWCEPETGGGFFGACRDRYGAELFAQGTGDLGDRMERALGHALGRGNVPILIGSDCPGYTADYLRQARDRLARGADIVLGPAEDGGYVLIGARRISSALFQGIAWGSATVLRQTRERLRALGWSWEELAPLWDLDRPEDHARLLENAALSPLAATSGS
jgi:rSAM/selenodomain-associated transferase 1